MTTTDCTILALTGPAGAGKDTIADHLVNSFGFARFAFADGPRAMLEALLSHIGVDHQWLYERHLKERPAPVVDASYRQLMQTLGTGWGRDMLHPDLWVHCLGARLGIAPGPRVWGAGGGPEHCVPVHDRIVITDVRYPNEAGAIHRWGGTLVGVTRPQMMAVRPHASEAHFGTLWGQCKTVFVNDSSLTSLHGLVNALCDDMGITPRIGGDLWAELNA